MKQAVILAGGKGTRLRERLGDLPKPLIDVAGSPLLERQIDLLKRYGFDSIYILVNYQAKKIVDFCESKNNWDIQIKCIDDGEPRGTAGAVLKILDLLQDEFLVIYGDTMLEVDLHRFYLFHKELPTVGATLFLHPNDHPNDSDLVEINDKHMITGFNSYPHPENAFFANLVNAALYWVCKSAIKNYVGLNGVIDFGRDLFPRMLKEGVLLRGYNSPEYIKDAGTPSRIDRVIQDYKSGKIQRASLQYKQKAIFVDRDGTLNYEVNYLHNLKQLKLYPGIGESIRRLNHSEYKVCVITNQPVIARGGCSEDDLKQIHNKLETLIAKSGAYVDRVFYCPHHPDSGFDGEVLSYKIICSCRKPNTLMIDRAVSELNIAKDGSWLIGDTSTDIQCAKNSGLRSILVETGFSGLDEKYYVTPDFVVKDFSTAVNFILDLYPTFIKKAEKIAEPIKHGAIVYVGGQSRSGKSTFSSLLAIALRNQGKVCHIIRTDNWLKNIELRGSGVLGRHDLEGFSTILEKIKNRMGQLNLSLPFYLKKSRKSIKDGVRITVEKNDIVIIEGIIALNFSKNNNDYKYYIETEEASRKKRMEHEYSLRGESIFFEKIYCDRLADESLWVEATAKDSTRINLDDWEGMDDY